MLRPGFFPQGHQLGVCGPNADGQARHRRHNLPADRTMTVTAWRAAQPCAHLQYASAHNSWLNVVRLWLAKIDRDCLARGIFTPVDDLRRQLLQYIRARNKHRHPFMWSYSIRVRDRG